MKKKSYLLILLSIFVINTLMMKAEPADPMMIELSRMFSKDLFDYNGTQYAKPIVTVSNATANARFYNDSYVPHKVDKPYFKFSLNGMYGFVNDDMKSFTPQMPMKEYNQEDMGKYLTILPTFAITDTAGFMEYILLNLLYDGFTNGFITHDEKYPTALGSKDVTYLDLGEGTLDTLLKRHSLYGLMKTLSPDMMDSLSSLLNQFPTRFPMPSGSDISSLFVGVPQFEIGSFLGTELLVRFIPELDLGSTFGKFSFWGLGLKHSISQYFNKGDKPSQRYFDLAIQSVWQSTHLENTIGVTNAKLSSDASIFNLNINASKDFGNNFIIYSGVSYESIDIDMKYKYYLPIEIQWQLGLIEQGKHEADPKKGFPGDTKPQVANMDFNESQIKLTMGVNYTINDFTVVADYSISRFNLLSFALQYKF